MVAFKRAFFQPPARLKPYRTKGCRPGVGGLRHQGNLIRRTIGVAPEFESEL
jgi:hypothetical protein